VTKILGGDSLIHNKTKDPEINRGSPRRRAPLARVRQDGDSAGDPWTKLGNCFFIMLCVVVFFTMNDNLFKSFSMHLYILVIHDLVIPHFIIIFFLESTHIKF
jgi:hypothetical protein